MAQVRFRQQLLTQMGYWQYPAIRAFSPGVGRVLVARLVQMLIATNEQALKNFTDSFGRDYCITLGTLWKITETTCFQV